MSTRGNNLRIAVSDLPPGRSDLPEEGRFFLYVRAGTAQVDDGLEPANIFADEGRFVEGPVTVSQDAHAWLFAVMPATCEMPGDIALSHPATPSFQPPYLLRADRIESQPGAQTPRHGHRGPGLRRLVSGRLRAEVGDHISRIETGGAWFETGADPVVGTNIGRENTVFVRLMLLPSALEGGRSSFVPMNATHADRPRSVQNRLFGETFLP